MGFFSNGVAVTARAGQGDPCAHPLVKPLSLNAGFSLTLGSSRQGEAEKNR
jgi:hypothetical protein